MLNTEEIKVFSQKFVRDILEKELFFQTIDRINGWDAIRLGGSCMRNFNDNISDIDLFLVTSVENQKKFLSAPVYVYSYHGKEFEVSMIATEKVFRDMSYKSDFWWTGSILLRSLNIDIERAFSQASNISSQDILEIIWTNFVIYEINTVKIDQLNKRNDMVSLSTCFFDSIEKLIRSILINHNIFCHNKWYGKNLRQIDVTLYDVVLELYSTPITEMRRMHAKMRSYFVDILCKKGFSSQEISDWTRYNVDKILFQKN